MQEQGDGRTDDCRRAASRDFDEERGWRSDPSLPAPLPQPRTHAVLHPTFSPACKGSRFRCADLIELSLRPFSPLSCIPALPTSSLSTFPIPCDLPCSLFCQDILHASSAPSMPRTTPSTPLRAGGRLTVHGDDGQLVRIHHLEVSNWVLRVLGLPLHARRWGL